MKKSIRQKKILDIISGGSVETQNELVQSLKSRGVDVTQATVSRDIKELKLTKTVSLDGRYTYSSEPYQIGEHSSEIAITERLLRVLDDGYVSCDCSANIVVVKTIVGMAPPCALAIDAVQWPEVLGTIAGDDTILIVTKSPEASEELVIKFRNMINHE